MAFSSFPLSYKSLQEIISSMYKNIHPFSFQKFEDVSPEQMRAQQQCENLKWQQNMFHRILNMVGLHNEGILSKEELDATKYELLYNLITSPAEGEWPAITRDKLLFLQELLYANCISEEDYHLSNRPLLLRMAMQGTELDSQDVLLRGNPIPCTLNTVRTEPDAPHALAESLNKNQTKWSVMEFNKEQEQCTLKSFPARSTGDNSKEKSPMKQMINALSLSLAPYKGGESKDKHPSLIVPRSLDLRSAKDCYPARNPSSLPMHESYKRMAIYINPTESFKENPFWQVAGLIDAPHEPVKRKTVKSSLLDNTLVSWTGHKRGATRAKVKKAFNQLLLKVHKDHSNESQTEASYSSHISDSDSDIDEQQSKLGKRTWGLDLFKTSKKNKSEEEMDYLPLTGERSEEILSPSKLVPKPIGQGPNTKKIKRKIHSDGAVTDFFIDKVLGENIKIELSRVLAEMGTTNPSPNFTNEQIESIATQLPVDKNELKKFFPSSWCERYGDVVLDVVRKQFKQHVGEMENLRITAQERRSNAAKRWGLKDHNVNCSPKTERSKGGIHNKLSSSNSLNRCYTNRDENTEPKITSAFTGQQPKSPFPFHHPRHKSPSPCNQTPHEHKSSLLFNHSNCDSTSFPCISRQSPKPPSSAQETKQFKIRLEPAPSNLYMERGHLPDIMENSIS